MKNFKQFPSKDLFCPVTAVEAIFAAIAPAEYHERNKGNSQVLNGDLRPKLRIEDVVLLITFTLRWTHKV